MDEIGDKHIDSTLLQSYQGCVENTRDGYGNESCQTFPHVNSTKEEEGYQEMHEGEHLSCDEVHGSTSENEDDHGLGDDVTHIDVTKDEFEELLDTVGEHIRMLMVSKRCLQKRIETHALIPILCRSGLPKTLGIICLIHHQLCK